MQACQAVVWGNGLPHHAPFGLQTLEAMETVRVGAGWGRPEELKLVSIMVLLKHRLHAWLAGSDPSEQARAASLKSLACGMAAAPLAGDKRKAQNTCLVCKAGQQRLIA